VAEKLLDLAFAIAAAEEARRVAEVREVVEKRVAVKTRVVQYSDAKMPLSLSFDGPACVDELVAESSTSSFVIDISLDDARITAPYSWFQQVSQLSDWIDAFSSNSGYVLRFAKLCFVNRFSVSFVPVYTTGSGESHVLSKVVVKISEQV
jgi:hypothetical protein